MREINFVETDADKIQNELTAEFEAISGRTLGDADPIKLLICWAVNIITQERVLINETAKQNLLEYAEGDHLDALAELYKDCTRLESNAAKVTMRCYISKARETDYIIPAGTRFSAGNVKFAAESQIIIPAGGLYGDVIAVCEEKGTVGNDFVPGTITEIVDVYQYYEKCENITISSGGTDTETDDSFRTRTRLSPEAYSTAGPEGAYVYHVKSVSEDIADVNVASPVEGEVQIYVLLKDGGLPSRELIADILNAVNDKKIRPLTDKVSVYAPTVVNYNVDFTYYIDSADETKSKEIDANVKTAASDFVLWQKGKIGRDINVSKLTEMLMQTGIKRVVISQPAFTEVANSEIAIASEIKINFGGVEND